MTKAGVAVMIGVAAALAALPGCQESAKGAVQLGFKGKVTTSKGQPVNAFTISVGRSPSTEPPKSANVTTKNGTYEARVPIAAPAVENARTLGAKTERVVIQVSAPGFKTKSFNVTADQVLVQEPNTLNVTLEASQ